MFFCFFGSCRFTNEQQNVEFGTNENLLLQWPVFANQLPNKHVQKNLCAHKQANEHMCKQMCAFVHQSCFLQEFWHSFHQKNLNCMQMHTNVCNCLQLHAIAHTFKFFLSLSTDFCVGICFCMQMQKGNLDHCSRVRKEQQIPHCCNGKDTNTFL